MNNNDDNTRYTHAVPQTIQASSNFLNNIANPWMFFALIVLLGSGYLTYFAIESNFQAINKVSIQNAQQLDMLNEILEKLDKLKQHR